MTLPRLYPIIDKETLDARSIAVSPFAAELARAGVGIVQYRHKGGAPQDVLRGAAEVAAELAGTGCILIMNDRADLAVIAGWPGVHVGHLDLSPADARKAMGIAPRWVGVSTHNDEQVMAAASSCADYIAIGPVFATRSKTDAEPVVGLEGLRRARALTAKPIVAIGGITRANVRAVMDAGADSVAVIGGMFGPGEQPGKVAGDFLELLR